ncbi:hypothetical protein Bca4012_100427 [Brassica carinata]
MAATSLGKTLEIRDRLPRLELSHEDDLKLRATRGEAGGFLDRCSNGGKVADRAWTLDVRAHLFAGLQRSMTVVTGRRSERRELASGWSHWVVQTTKALDT